MQEIRVCTYDGPGAQPIIRTVPWPKVGKKAALIKIGACGVCGTDLHILKGHWPKPLPWPFTLGHELGGVIVECGSELREAKTGLVFQNSRSVMRSASHVLRNSTSRPIHLTGSLPHSGARLAYSPIIQICRTITNQCTASRSFGVIGRTVR